MYMLEMIRPSLAIWSKLGVSLFGSPLHPKSPQPICGDEVAGTHDKADREEEGRSERDAYKEADRGNRKRSRGICD